MTTRRMGVLLPGAAALAAGSALVSDAMHGGHPTHLLVLGVVAVVVASLRRLGRHAVAAFPVIPAAFAVQPVLHLMSETTGPDTAGTDHRDLVHHLLVTEVPTAGVQVAVPALAVITTTVVAPLLHLLFDAVRRPPASPTGPCTPPRALVPIRARRLGSMLRWCGWALHAARRGPPQAPAFGIV